MIDPKEIRIGNYLYREGQPDMVTGIFHEMWGSGEVHVIQAKNKLDYRIDKFEPIPLSPAILEKCGFELAPDDEKPYFGGYLLEITKGHKIRLRSKATWYTWTSQFGDIEFYYLHQLQNLYYSLTGTELTITL